MAGSSFPGGVQVIEPEEPDSVSVRPNAQKTCAAWYFLKEEVIKRQQQSDMQGRLAFLGIAAPTETHRYPTNQQIGQRTSR